MRKILAPKAVACPAGDAYHHGLLISQPREVVRLAGQIGLAPDGVMGEGIERQAELAWDNIEAILAEAGMTVADVCKVVSYVVGRENTAGYMAVHRRRTAGHTPPWTLIPLPALGGPDCLVEVDVEAMR
jgi:2-iminobutanoate/2-iminopropanoate deaminase